VKYKRTLREVEGGCGMAARGGNVPRDGGRFFLTVAKSERRRYWSRLSGVGETKNVAVLMAEKRQCIASTVVVE